MDEIILDGVKYLNGELVEGRIQGSEIIEGKLVKVNGICYFLQNEISGSDKYAEDFGYSYSWAFYDTLYDNTGIEIFKKDNTTELNSEVNPYKVFIPHLLDISVNTSSNTKSVMVIYNAEKLLSFKCIKSNLNDGNSVVYYVTTPINLETIGINKLLSQVYEKVFLTLKKIMLRGNSLFIVSNIDTSEDCKFFEFTLGFKRVDSININGSKILILSSH